MARKEELAKTKKVTEERYKLGNKYRYGTEVNVKKATVNGSAEAQYNLGLVYEYGKLGMEKNAVTAKEWYEKAASQGVDDAKKHLEQLEN